jgi:hypothetical protein
MSAAAIHLGQGHLWKQRVFEYILSEFHVGTFFLRNSHDMERINEILWNLIHWVEMMFMSIALGVMIRR